MTKHPDRVEVPACFNQNKPDILKQKSHILLRIDLIESVSGVYWLHLPGVRHGELSVYGRS